MAHVYVRGQQIVVQHEGHEFEVWVGEDNHFYLYDPHLLLDTEHVALPTTRRVVSSEAPGLGDLTRMAVTNVVPLALNFVPVVGPILSAVASVAGALTGSMFGGNDPTPAMDLQNRVIQLRTQIFQANQALGIPDAMPTIAAIRASQGLTTPAGFQYKHGWPDLPMILELWPHNAGIDDPNHWQCDFTGVNCKGCGHVRKCSYAAINRLSAVLAQLEAQLHDRQLTQSIFSQVGAAGVAPGVVAPGGSSSSAGGGVSPGGAFSSDGSSLFTSGPGGAPGFSESSMFSSAGGVLPLFLGGAALIIALASQGKGTARRASQRTRS